MNIISKITKTYFDEEINCSVTSQTIYLFDKIPLYKKATAIKQQPSQTKHILGFRRK